MPAEFQPVLQTPSILLMPHGQNVLHSKTPHALQGWHVHVACAMGASLCGQRMDQKPSVHKVEWFHKWACVCLVAALKWQTIITSILHGSVDGA